MQIYLAVKNNILLIKKLSLLPSLNLTCTRNQYTSQIKQKICFKRSKYCYFLSKLYVCHDAIFSQLMKSKVGFIEIKISKNIQILKDLRFSAKWFFNLANEKIS